MRRSSLCETVTLIDLELLVSGVEKSVDGVRVESRNSPGGDAGAGVQVRLEVGTHV
jgi:hypothetical protein